MFLKYRIQKLKMKINVQKMLVEKLEVVSDEYGRAYYTDRLIKEYHRLLKMNGKLDYLMQLEASSHG